MTLQEQIKKAIILGVLTALMGRFFQIRFYSKSDGRVITRTAQKFRRDRVTGGRDYLENAPAISYFDLNKNDWRAFRIENLVSIKCGDYVFKGDYQE
jgi:restriction endonuclease S subunit